MRTFDEVWLDEVLGLRDGSIGTTVTSRIGETNEDLAFTGCIDPRHGVLMNPRRKIDIRYAAAELLWILQQSRSIRMISAYAPQYTKFSDIIDGEPSAYGAYGYRICKFNQLNHIIRMLLKTPNSRQAVLSLWSADDLSYAVDSTYKDLPCTLGLQFLLRNGRLHLIATMRSNDLWLGTPYDVFCFTTLQHIVADALSVELGSYMHQVGSMHIYEKNFKAADECEQLHCSALSRIGRMDHQYNGYCFNLNHALEIAFFAEQAFRLSADVNTGIDILKTMPQAYTWPNILYDCVLCAGSKWHPLLVKFIHSPMLQERANVNH